MAAETVAAGIGVEGMHVVIAPKLLADLAGAKVATFAQATAPVRLEELPVCVNGRLMGRQGMRLGIFVMVFSIVSSGSEFEWGRNPCHLHKRRMGRLFQCTWRRIHGRYFAYTFAWRTFSLPFSDMGMRRHAARTVDT
jgi:hypothetical protein